MIHCSQSGTFAPGVQSCGDNLMPDKSARISTSFAVSLALCACLYSSSGPVVVYSILYSGYFSSNFALISSIALLMFSCFQCKILITCFFPEELLAPSASFPEAALLPPPPQAARLSVNAPARTMAEIFLTMIFPPICNQ
ncbi:hypothetical protein D3C77_490470 [compost metagenome]